MSTRSAIIIRLPNGKYFGTTCHFDGDIGCVGKILVNYYQSPNKITKLINLGQISSLGRDLRTSPLVKKYGFDFMMNPKFSKLSNDTKEWLKYQAFSGDYTTAYFRDRHEPNKIGPWTWTKHELKVDINDDMIADTDFVYVFEDHYWYLAADISHKAISKPNWPKVSQLLKIED